jgi:hypothetical protein
MAYDAREGLCVHSRRIFSSRARCLSRRGRGRAREDEGERGRRELARRGWGDEDLGNLASGNVLRAMRRAEAVAARLRKARPPSTATIEALDGLGV